MTGWCILCIKHPNFCSKPQAWQITQSRVGNPQGYPAAHDGYRICVVVSTLERSIIRSSKRQYRHLQNKYPHLLCYRMLVYKTDAVWHNYLSNSCVKTPPGNRATLVITLFRLSVLSRAKALFGTAAYHTRISYSTIIEIAWQYVAYAFSFSKISNTLFM